MSTWQTVALGDVAEFVRGINFKPEDVTSVGKPGSVACMRTKNVQKDLDLSDVWAVPESFVKREEQILQAGDILVSSANSWNLVGKCCWIPQLSWRATFGGFVSILRANHSKIESRYLFHWFSSNRVQKTLRSFGQQTTNISNLNTQRCLRLLIPLPSLEEQRRIADILDRAEALRTKRRAALAQLDELIKSIFFDMFGDPIKNPKGWQRVPLAELLINIDSGWSPICLDRPVEGEEWGVLKLGAVTWCEYNPVENKALPENINPDPNLEVKPGDLLFTRKNTYELVAACALVRETPPRLMMSDLIFRLRLRQDAEIDPKFLHQLLIYPTKRREIQKLAGGSASSMPNISKTRLNTALIEIPPLAIQKEFSRRIATVEKLKEAHKASLEELDKLFASLQYRAFRGEL